MPDATTPSPPSPTGSAPRLILSIIMIVLGQITTTVAGMCWQRRGMATVLGIVAACVLVGAVFVGRA